jgi:hypothetical protein
VRFDPPKVLDQRRGCSSKKPSISSDASIVSVVPGVTGFMPGHV